MKLRVRYFARLREIAGRDEESVDLPDGSTAADLYAELQTRHEGLRGLRRHVRVAVNHDFSDWGTPLQDGDELAFIPPVSGGSDSAGDPTGRFLVTMQPLSVDAVVDSVRRDEAGAITTFQGVVRNRTGERDVVRLEYDAYVEMALQKLQQTAAEAIQRWPATFVAVHHRYGVLDIGESAVVIAVSSPHRAESFDACRYVIDRLKEVVPIWKKEVSPDGSEWVGMGP